MIIIKRWIRDWLEIKDSVNIVVPKNVFSENEFEFNMMQGMVLDLKNKNKELEVRMVDIEARLRPIMRVRLEQCKSAIDIQTKFLNEIWYEIKKKDEKEER